MDYEATYAQIVLPDRVRVLGRALVAPTIGHMLLLFRLRSPFVIGGKAKPYDIAFATWVLSREYLTAARRSGTSYTAWILKVWTIQMAFMSQTAVTKAEAYLRRTIRNAYEGPPLWDSDEAVKRCNAPYLQVLKVRLMTGGTSRLEAMNYPVREAIWDLACRAEDSGSVEWVDEDHAEAIEELTRRS